MLGNLGESLIHFYTISLQVKKTDLGSYTFATENIFIQIQLLFLTRWGDFFKRWKANDSMYDYIHTHTIMGQP